MILFILAAYFAYKKANSTGRSGIAWALITAAVYLGIQILLALGIGVFIGLGITFFGWSESLFDDLNILISIICAVAGFGGVWLVFRYLDKTPKEESIPLPPPPPTFNGQ